MGQKALVDALAYLTSAGPSLHPLHHKDRPWPQVNCSVDLMIELVAALGLDPHWMLAFTLRLDFEGDHFTFLKVPNADVEALYGLVVQELAVWDDLEQHVLAQVQRGNVVLVDVDGYFLPDTQGLTYRENHGKTTIGIYAMDPGHCRLSYFHNEIRGTLEGHDYDGALQKLDIQSCCMMPYCEVVKPVGSACADPASLALAQARYHWARRPAKNPFSEYAEVFLRQMAHFGSRDAAYFHAYAFNTLRQVGANYGLMESFLLRLQDKSLAEAAASAATMAELAKVMQFKLARAMQRKQFDALLPMLQTMAGHYDLLSSQLEGSQTMGSMPGHG